MSSRKVTGLPLPNTPREAPPEIHGLVDAIESKLGDSKILEAVSALSCAFDYLTRYFAAVAGASAQIVGLDGESGVPKEFDGARQLLKDRLILLGDKATDPTSKLIRSIFFVGATRKTPTPRRPARLLDLGGIPIRGYLPLAEWVQLEPGKGDLETESKGNRELLRYLPILKEWVTATATYFLDVEQGPLTVAGPDSVIFDITLNGETRTAGPVVLPPETQAVLEPYLEGEFSGGEPEEDSPPVAQAVDTPTEEASSAEDTPAEPATAEDAPAKAHGEPPEDPTDTAEFPLPEEVKEAAASISEPPKIEVVGVEPAEEPEGTESEEEPTPSTGPVSAQPEPDYSEEISPPLQSESLQQAEPEPVQEQPTPEVKEEQTEVPNSPPLPDPEVDEDKAPEPASPDPVGETGADESKLVEENKEPEVPEPAPEALADPVVAALHEEPEEEEDTPRPEPEKKEPVKLKYPTPTGPPPEFFDEIPVEADYPNALTTAITDLNGAIESNDSRLMCGQLQRCLDIMVQLFSGLAGSMIMELDREALMDFEVDDERFDLSLKVDLIVTALSCLEDFWERDDSANLLWSVFYDTLLPATDPDCAYLHTLLLGVEGLAPKPYLEFSEFCTISPGEGKLATPTDCRRAVHYYLPVLEFWLENAMPLFLESELDFVEEEDGEALSWAASVSGKVLDGTCPGFWLEVASDRWNLPDPDLAAIFVSGDAPDLLIPIIDELNLALEKKQFDEVALKTRITLDFLIQYFAGCSASLWRQQGAMTEQALELFYPDASLGEKERLLLLSLGGISTESETGLALGKLFSKGSLQYRALSQTGQPAGIHSVSQWASSRGDVEPKEVLLYLSLLRAWVGAANPWFAGGEQLFEEPTEDGILEGVVVHGDEFLEMVDPEYVIQLPRECLEIVAPAELEKEEEEKEPVKADTPFTGKLPQIQLLSEGPPVLLGHVGRLLEAHEDRRAANAWLGSAFEYLIQYYAGLCTTILGGQQAPIEKSALKAFKPGSSLRERERLLVAALEHLRTAATGSVQESVRDIFFKPDGSHRLHTKYLGFLGAGSLTEDEMLLSYWCRMRHKLGHLSSEELHFGTGVLNSWLEASKAFFSSCEHYAEDPGADGQEEMVVELADDYLDMVLPDYAIQLPARGYYDILYAETDGEAVTDAEIYFPEDVRPELLGPKEVVLGGAADQEEELELLGAAGDLGGGDDFFAGAPAGGFDSDDLFAGSSAPTQQLDPNDFFAGPAPGETVEEPDLAKAEKATSTTSEKSETPKQPSTPYKRKRKKKSKKSELGSAVLELYKKERLEKARRRAEARARKAEAEPTVLNYSLDYRGLKNSKQLGGRGHFGLLEVKNIGGGELKGTVEPAHPCVRVSPSRFEGNQVRIVYQVDPADMPSTGRTGINLITQNQKVAIKLDQLVPTSWFRERTTVQAVALLAAPSLVYAGWLFMLFGVLLGPSLKSSIASFAYNTQLESIPWSTHLSVWMLAVLAILPGATAIPAAIKSIFARLDYTVQEETRVGLIPLMLLPCVVMVAILQGTDLWSFNVPKARLPGLGSRFVLMMITFGLNVLATALFSLQTTVWWEDNSDSETAKRTFIGFWAATVILGLVVTFFLW